MKKQLLVTAIGLAIVLGACSNKANNAGTVGESTTVATDNTTVDNTDATETSIALSKAKIHLKYSNLADNETRDRVKKALANAGLSEDKINKFFEAVDEYNNAVGSKNLVQEMTSIEAAFPTFDQDKLIDAWLNNNQGFVGRNCRITSYSLMGDFIKVGNKTPGDTTMLFNDFAAIDAKKIFEGEDKEKFDTIFSYIDVNNTHDTNELADEIVKSWNDKQISFDNDKMHMISVFMRNCFGTM